MSQTASSALIAEPAEGPVERPAAGSSGPFCGLIDAILVNGPVPHAFAGSVDRAAAQATWTWVVRDLCPDLVSAEGVANGAVTAALLEPLVPELLARMKAAFDRVSKDAEALRKFRAQLGRDQAKDEVAVVMAALRNRALLAKAQSFGRAINSMGEDSALGTALQSMPLQDGQVAALLFHAAVGQLANPTRLITAVIKLSGGTSEAAIDRHGFTPLIEAYLAHAQNQLHFLQLSGTFADTDLACRSLERFHRLMRALTGYIEFSRISRPTQVLATVTKIASDRIEPRLREVLIDLNQAMRRPREGADRLDQDRLFGAINGFYLMSAVRDCRDSLALNAVFDQAWSQSGQALELHIQRNLDLLRQNPADSLTATRLDAAIKMAEIRFNPEYADTLRRARTTVERRA